MSPSKIVISIWIPLLAAILGAVYQLLNYQVLSSAKESIQFWVNSESVSIQQGNLLSSVAKFERIINNSTSIAGVSVFEEPRQPGTAPLLEVGRKIPPETHSPDEIEGRFLYHKLSLFNRLVTFKPEGRNDIAIVFLISGAQTTKTFFRLIGVLAIGFLISGLFLYFHNKAQQRENIQFLFEYLDNIIKQKPLNEKSFRRARLLYGNWSVVKSQLEKLVSLQLLAVKAAENLRISQQVSHDIRSPLAALDMISGTLKGIDEESRIILRNSINRIRDIANSLSAKDSSTTLSVQKLQSLDSNGATNSNSSQQNTNTLLLSPIIDSIITEKRIQFRSDLSVQIDFLQDQASYGMFAKINAVELKRVISNLVNNAIEALPNKIGRVEISVKEEKGQIQLSVIDNGMGMPPEVLKNAGTPGFTHGKPLGSGLGLSHAKTTVESWGGSLSISSNSTQTRNIGNSGTTVTLNLPKQPAPSWFVPSLEVKRNLLVVVFDDDLSIHQVWKGRFESIGHHASVINFSNVQGLRDFYRKDYLRHEDVLFLMDFEILNESITGLDLIEELGTAKDSILVTSRFEEPEVLSRCDALGVKLIPKPLAGFVPMLMS